MPPIVIRTMPWPIYVEVCMYSDTVVENSEVLEF